MAAEQDARQLLDRFQVDEYPPVLDAYEQAAMRDLLGRMGLALSYGTVAISGPAAPRPRSTEALLRSDQEARQELERNPQAIIGPNFLGDDYYPHAIGIWKRMLAPL